jgi:hypothetical protein
MSISINLRDFRVIAKSVRCPECAQLFNTEVMDFLPPFTKFTLVESDLHRVLPFAALRGTLIVICPKCLCSWWHSAFQPVDLEPGQTVMSAPMVDPPKKFAQAMLTGRKNNIHSIDRAMVAFNGYWCARECAQPHEKWLTLVAQELTTALEDTNWFGNRARYRYLLAETFRLMGEFRDAVRQFDQVDVDCRLPLSLIERQKKIAQARMDCPVLLPIDAVDEIFIQPPEPLPGEIIEVPVEV